MSYNTDLTISNSCGHMIYLPALQVTEDLLSLLSANCNVLLEKLSCQIQFWCCETDLQRERLLNLHGHWVFLGCFFWGGFCPTPLLVSFEPQSRTNPLTVSFPALPTVSSLCLPTLSHSAPGLAGGLCWWLWLPTCWNSQEWWRLGGGISWWQELCEGRRAGRALQGASERSHVAAKPCSLCRRGGWNMNSF